MYRIQLQGIQYREYRNERTNEPELMNNTYINISRFIYRVETRRKLHIVFIVYSIYIRSYIVSYTIVAVAIRQQQQQQQYKVLWQYIVADAAELGTCTSILNPWRPTYHKRLLDPAAPDQSPFNCTYICYCFIDLQSFYRVVGQLPLRHDPFNKFLLPFALCIQILLLLHLLLWDRVLNLYFGSVGSFRMFWLRAACSFCHLLVCQSWLYIHLSIYIRFFWFLVWVLSKNKL